MNETRELLHANGYAIHQILIGIKDLEYAIPYRVEIIKE